ncbi:MAG: hypothetical protein IPN38_16250 [Flavobacteriales bacterium]|nr:hypothetical protein [Flavobacteriales bacterium]
MDAIRKAMEPKPDVLEQLAQREARPGPEVGRSADGGACSGGRTRPTAKGALTVKETATGAKRLLHFNDHRPPHEIQFVLERNLMTLFAASMEYDRLILRAVANVVGARYDVELRFEAAMPHQNCYSLQVETSWADAAATHHDYYRKTAGSWFSHWTRDFLPAEPPAADAGAPERYQAICLASLNAEAHLGTVTTIQQTIVAAMKAGGRFSTSHKEGGTNISWNGEHFVRSDYGDYPDHRTFATEAEFLQALRLFYDWETSANAYPEKVSDLVAWKLILRLLRT